MLERAQREKKNLIRKLEEEMAKKTFDPKNKVSKNDLKLKENKIVRSVVFLLNLLILARIRRRTHKIKERS